jgi:hypothetical protein
MPGVGLADGGIPTDVPMDLVPVDLRTPNTNIWVRLDEEGHVQEVWRREEVEEQLSGQHATAAKSLRERRSVFRRLIEWIGNWNTRPEQNPR